ncbi:MAG: hypothetical protein P8Z38_04575 [Robiginitalea sp.]
MKEKYLQDLKEIREMMSRSSRFISLSGLSGISAGIVALVGAYLIHSFVFEGGDYLTFEKVVLPGDALTDLLLIGLGTLVVSISLVIFLTTRETKKRHQKVWDQQTRRILISLSIPLVTGGIVCLVFLSHGYAGLVLPMTLVFYGLALVNASKYTLDEIRNLGLLEIVLGLLAFQFISFGLILWAVGFGLLHIVYGIIVKTKYPA